MDIYYAFSQKMNPNNSEKYHKSSLLRAYQNLSAELSLRSARVASTTLPLISSEAIPFFLAER